MSKEEEKRIREISLQVEVDTIDEREDKHLRFIWTHEQMIEVAKRYGEEIKADHQLALAEAQLLGFKHALGGGSVEDLVSSMGLTKDEWDRLNKDYSLYYLTDSDKEDIEEFLNKE